MHSDVWKALQSIRWVTGKKYSVPTVSKCVAAFAPVSFFQGGEERHSVRHWKKKGGHPIYTLATMQSGASTGRAASPQLPAVLASSTVQLAQAADLFLATSSHCCVCRQLQSQFFLN